MPLWNLLRLNVPLPRHAKNQGNRSLGCDEPPSSALDHVLSHQVISGAKDLVCSTMTRTKDVISSGMANVVDTAKGAVQGGLGMTRSALTGTKDAVASGVTGAVGVAKEAIHFQG